MANLKAVLENIHIAEAERAPDSPPVTLLAVSKGQSAEKLREAYRAGQTAFGENYLQEALEKIEVLSAADIEWHFIGSLQSNKTKAVAENFAWVQSISRIKIAERLNAQRPMTLPPLNVCVEVNVDHEPTKSGIFVEDLRELLDEIVELKNLRCRGLMVIPAKGSLEETRSTFKIMFALYRSLQAEGYPLDTLSMGMSGDYVEAIQAGSTMVRVGSAIFGERQ